MSQTCCTVNCTKDAIGGDDPVLKGFCQDHVDEIMKEVGGQKRPEPKRTKGINGSGVCAEAWVHPAFGGDDFCIEIDFDGPHPGEPKDKYLFSVVAAVLKALNKHKSCRFDDFVIEIKGYRFTPHSEPRIKMLADHIIKKRRYGRYL